MLHWLERNQVPLLGFALLILALGLGARALIGGGAPPSLEFRSDARLPGGAPIRVHVAGAVLAPGVYELRQGDRVAEALAAAGGPSDAADLEAVNLARRLADEQQVVIPRRGAEAAAEVLAAGTKVDINTASAALLDQLPGIGEAYSRRIVDSRTLDGPYASIEELVERHVIPRATFDRISAFVVVGAVGEVEAVGP